MSKYKRKSVRVAKWLEKKYYHLGYKPRHIIGILLAILLLAGAVGIGYGSYCGVKACYHFVVNIFTSDWNLFGDDEEDEYSSNSYRHHKFPVPSNKRHPKRVPNFSRDFSFVNDVHLSAATKLGIEPQDTREALEKQTDKLVKLHDTKYYQILPLTASSPYLVPRAADFLTDLGRLMQEYNGTKSRFLISSVLRTQEDVSKLSRVNVNASKKSTHCYGTTFDITYVRFDMKGDTYEGKLKEDLAKALYDLQSMGYCYVKYEIRQPCFHVTVRP